MIIDRVELPGGAFRMGSDAFYPEEGPVHEMHVAAFALGRYAVTNRQFAEFVEDTGYVTVAERPLDPALFPQLDAGAREPGSLVFTPTDGPVDLRDWRQWWRWVPGASWRTPRGPGSGIDGLEDHPVVQVAYDDAVAFAQWAGGRLPTEAEWEYAARGGIDGAPYAWGDEGNDGTRANTWQGRFPYEHQRVSDGVYTMPVGSFPANGFGLHEMTGNTWEWTSTPWSSRHPVDVHCAPGHDHEHAPQAPERVLKGGSHLCSPEYCLRYRPAARSAQTEDSAATHLGFRVAFDIG